MLALVSLKSEAYLSFGSLLHLSSKIPIHEHKKKNTFYFRETRAERDDTYVKTSKGNDETLIGILAVFMLTCKVCRIYCSSIGSTGYFGT